MSEEISFKYCVAKPFKGKWAVFTPEPQNQKGYIFLIRRNTYKGRLYFFLIPMWAKCFENRKKPFSKRTVVKLAKDYDKFCENSEWF